MKRKEIRMGRGFPRIRADRRGFIFEYLDDGQEIIEYKQKGQKPLKV
jgi:hypothetical protein